MKKEILKQYEKGNIVVTGWDGFQVYSLKEFVKQPTEGILYDLNRDEATILTFIEDEKWINDYASSMVIKALKNKIEELEKPLVNKIDREKILDDINDLQEQTDNTNFKGQNEHDLFLRELITDYITELITNKPIV